MRGKLERIRGGKAKKPGREPEAASTVPGGIVVLSYIGIEMLGVTIRRAIFMMKEGHNHQLDFSARSAGNALHLN